MIYKILTFKFKLIFNCLYGRVSHFVKNLDLQNINFSYLLFHPMSACLMVVRDESSFGSMNRGQGNGDEEEEKIFTDSSSTQ